MGSSNAVMESTNSLLFGPGLLSTVGGQHKKQRKMLTPAFSVKHLRGMTPMFVSIAREVCKFDITITYGTLVLTPITS